MDRLRVFYGALPAPPPRPFAVYIWEVLSVASRPARRDAAFNALKRARALTADAVSRLPQAALEAAIGLAGARRDERIRALRAGADLFRRDPSIEGDFAASFRRALRAARRLPHLGRASSLKVLLFSGHHAVLPLDEDALRVALRLGYGRDLRSAVGGPQSEDTIAPARAIRLARQALRRETRGDTDSLRALSQYLTHHGIATCTETAPHCAVCPLAPECAWVRNQ